MPPLFIAYVISRWQHHTCIAGNGFWH